MNLRILAQMLSHVGSCQGRGLWQDPTYHGYRRLDEVGELLETMKCPCCLLHSPKCRKDTCLLFAFWNEICACHFLFLCSPCATEDTLDFLAASSLHAFNLCFSSSNVTTCVPNSFPSHLSR